MIQRKYLKRKIDNQLLTWKENIDHFPLIVSGARQVGKSSSILHFAHDYYESVIGINFIDHPEYKQISENGYSSTSITAKSILSNISRPFFLQVF